MASAPSPEPTFRLTYRSRSNLPPEGRKVELGLLFSQARSHNKSQGITGALLVADDWFVQTLEGEQDAVRALYARISRDPRHHRVALLTAGPAQERVFSRWSMARVADEGETDIPLIAHGNGISPAASRGDASAGQAQVLAAMRTAAREAPAATAGV